MILLYDRPQLRGDWVTAVGSLDSHGTEQLHFENADALVRFCSDVAITS